MNHEQATDLFSAYWDRELSAEDHAALEDHLSACLVCRREFQQFEKTVGLLRSNGRVAAPARFAAKLKKRAKKRGVRVSHWQTSLTRTPYEVFSLIMLAALLAVYVLLSQSQPTHLRLP